MVSNKITEGVGKKIVEALKQQSDIEIQNVVDNSTPIIQEQVTEENNSSEIEFTTNTEEDTASMYVNQDNMYEEKEEVNDEQKQSFDNTSHATFNMPNMMSYNQPSQIAQPNITEKDNFANDLDGFEIPTNIAVLKQLINQLPAGVSKQTGAIIIKQTMEALGISMKSVLQEAQQVQESLNNSVRECQASIMEYKKQINVLEKQSQKFQRQYSALNDIISLFIQTSI